jgi:hypothetical protein
VLRGASLVLQSLQRHAGPVGLGERRLHDGPRPQAPGQDDIHLGAVHDNPHSQVDPREQAQHRGEDAIGSVAVQKVVDQVGTHDLQDRPRNAADNRARQQPPGRHNLRGQHPEGTEVHRYVDDGRGDLGEDHQDERLAPVGVEARESRRHDHSGPQQGEKKHGTTEPLHVAGPRRTRQVPDLLHREQPSLSQPRRPPDQR